MDFYDSIEIEDFTVRAKPCKAISFRVQPEESGDSLVWRGADALFFLESIWDDLPQSKRTFAQQYGPWMGKLRESHSSMFVQKMVPEAVVPTKAHPTDSGFDITAVRIVKENFGKNITLYGTGLIVKPPDGFYIDLVARSSLCKLGYMLANSVGIIDASYRGELCIPLLKLDPSAPDIELPARVCQIILRPLYLADVVEVDSIGSTERGTGGFGSSN